jgi:hypothetical protein
MLAAAAMIAIANVKLPASSWLPIKEAKSNHNRKNNRIVRGYITLQISRPLTTWLQNQQA